MTRTIVITSGKGGVGKSNISVNIALELARRKYRTCLLDADLGLANVNILLGIHPEKNLDDLLFDDTPLESIIMETGFGVDVIPGSSGVEQIANLSRKQLFTLVKGFAGLTGYDFLLIDTSSGISRGVVSFCLAASETLLVLTGESTSLADAYGLLKVLSVNNYQGTVKILVNKCASVPQAKKTFAHFKSVADKHLNITIVPGGAILADPAVEKAVSSQQPAAFLFPESAFSLCIKALVSNLLRTDSGNTEGADCGSFWSRFTEYIQGNLHLPGQARKLAVYKEEPRGKPLISITESGTSEQEKTIVDSPPCTTKSDSDRTCTAGLYPGLLTASQLPTPLPLLSSLLTMQSHGELSLEQMKAAVRCDAALTGRLLQNSHLSRLQRTRGIVSIETVLAETDQQVLSRLLLSTASHSLLSCGAQRDDTALHMLWGHSLRCALMARSLAEIVEYPFPEEVYLAGLLHDTGRLARPGESMEKSEETLYDHQFSGEQSASRDKQMAGMGHAELGAAMLTDWNLSGFIVDAVRYHGETEKRVATALSMTRLVYLAHMLSSPVEEELSRGIEQGMRLFNLSASQIFTCVQIVSRQLAEVAARYNIPYRGDVEPAKSTQMLNQYRQQAIDFVTIQSVLQLPDCRKTVEDLVCMLHQGLNLLFGIDRVVCLFANEEKTHLQAAGHSGCFAEEYIDNIQFFLQSNASLIIAAYRSGIFTTLYSQSLSSMADRQLMNLLDSEVLLCLPLKAPAVGHITGLLICGVSRFEHERCVGLKQKMESFALQATMKMDCETHSVTE